MSEPSSGPLEADRLYDEFLRALRGPESPYAPGRTLGEFRLVEWIGQGGMGIVWRAEQLGLGREVALKLVRPDRVDALALERFAREARASGRLSHPGIVAVHAYGEAEGVRWIAQELVEGGDDLRRFLRRAREQDELPASYFARVARLVSEIADALQAAHEAGVIHRDLKPENVLLDAGGRPKITDFGLARLSDESSLSRTGELVGTYAYMSPEQITSARKAIDHRTDVFSLGVVLYELLALQRPFQGDTSHQITKQIVERDPPDPRSLRSQVPRELAVVAGKALEKEPARRFQSMAELAADLRRFLAHEPIRARPPTRLERTRKWVRRNPGKSGALGAAVVLSALILSLSLKNLSANALLADRATQIGRLAAFQELDELVAEADRLWPPRPEWIETYEAWNRRAEGLRAELDAEPGGSALGHRGQLRSLEARALPRTPAEIGAERSAHPRYAEFEALRSEVESRRAAQRVRSGELALQPYALEGIGWEVGDDAGASTERALALAGPEHREFGREREALALARRAEELVEDDATYAKAKLAQAWAAFACGLDADSREAARVARELGGKASIARGLDALAEVMADESAALETAEARLADLDALLSERRAWRFEDASDAWWHGQLERLIAAIEELFDPERGLASVGGISNEHGWSVPRRLAFARRLRAGFAEGGEFDARWRAASSAIAAACPEVEVRPIAGLVPIGADPRSGKLEFWHVQSGDEPGRGDDGSLRIGPESGLVLVLLPGGRFAMGAQSTQADAPNYAADAHPSEAPVHAVELSPFFLSKYEMTQAQWVRTTGRNPSFYSPESRPRSVDPLHPVEQVDWNDCLRVTRWLGLELPSEARWEYACRAGTSTPWSCALEELVAHENLMDQAYRRAFVETRLWASWDDGFGFHAPVGSLLPNAFGLYDVHGNVLEWCADGYDAGFYLRSPLRNPVAPTDGARSRVLRGGSFSSAVALARSAYRDEGEPGIRGHLLGLRPAASWR